MRLTKKSEIKSVNICLWEQDMVVRDSLGVRIQRR